MIEMMYAMKKAKHSLIRIERIDGETVMCNLDGDDAEELLAMLGDGLAEWLAENPQDWRTAKRLTRRVFEDYCPDLLSYWLDGIVGRMLACGVIFAAMCGLAAWVG